MAKDNSKEAKYRRSMEALGTYHEAMEPLIHDLCTLERECARTRKAWKATAEPGKAPSPLDDLYDVIRAQQRDILQLRTALGLTPMALKRVKGVRPPEVIEDEKPATVLDLVLKKQAGA